MPIVAFFLIAWLACHAAGFVLRPYVKGDLDRTFAELGAAGVLHALGGFFGIASLIAMVLVTALG